MPINQTVFSKRVNFYKNRFGGTLIELLVVIGIITLLSIIVMPNLRKYQPNLKLNASARDLTADIRYAQQLTVTEQKVHIVSFDLIKDKYYILRIDAATTTVKTVTLDPEVSFKQITDLTNNQVIFNFYGGVSQSGTVTLTNANNVNATINIKPSGYIQLMQ